MAWGILVPWPRNQGSNSCPLQWKRTVLTTGPPGNSGKDIFKSEGFQNLPPVPAFSFHRESESKWERKQRRKAPDPVSRGPVDMTHAGNSQDEVKGNAAWPTTAAGRAWAQTAQSKQGHGPGGVTPRENGPDRSPVEDYSPLGFPVAQMVKNMPAMQETQVRPLGGEDALEKGMATHYSSILAWRIQRTEDPGRLQSTGLQRVGHDWATYIPLLPNTLALSMIPLLSVPTPEITDPCPLRWKGWPKNLLDPTYPE